MADIAAGDVTYSILKVAKEDSSLKTVNMTIAFGNGTLNYPANGIPLTAGNMGLPNNIQDVELYSPASANGFVYKYDQANNKIRIYQAPAQTHGHDFTITKGAILASSELGLSADATSATVNNDTIAATRVLAKATGPVASETLAAAVLVEVGNVAVTAVTLYARARGW